MNVYYDVEDNHYRTYPDGDIATVDQMRELIENKNVSIVKLQQENKQLKDNWIKLKEYCQDNSFMQNTREYGTLTVVDADELAVYMEELESGDSNE